MNQNEITLRVMNANEDRIDRYLKEIYYKVCSTVPLVLCLFEGDISEIMSLNKTTVSMLLKQKGFKELSKNYSTMLKNVNKYYLTKNINVARESIVLGHAVLLECLKIAKQHII